jgi:DNA-directed RNA polymerase subunit RPC12/RpoP
VFHFRATVKTEVPVEYECHECSLMMDVLVKTRGAATGMWPGQALKERAMDLAVKAAEMRAELWPCPHCGTRRLDMWRQSFIRVVLLIPFLVAGIWLIEYFADPWLAKQDYNLWIYLGVFLFFELLCVGAMLYELRAAKTAVRPLVRDVED